MTAIRPFRHLIVYPRMLGDIERKWQRRGGDANRAEPAIP
jgi:hypothetical protein